MVTWKPLRVVLFALALAVTVLYLYSSGRETVVDSVIGPGKGFKYLVPGSNPIIAPDLALLSQYRTSQLIYLGQKVVPSRQVLHTYNQPSPKLVVVVGLDADRDESHLAPLLNDKVAYAEKHGYGLFCRYYQDTAVQGASVSDALGIGRLVLLRQAMLAFPDAEWVWHVDQDSIIMNADFDLMAVTKPEFIEAVMLKGEPLSENQPDIKTYRHLRAKDVSMLVSRTDTGLNPRSILVRNDLIGRAYLEYATDPLNQNYGPFQSDPASPSELLTHMTAWHPRFLAHTALVPSRLLGSSETQGKVSQKYSPGDFLYLMNPTYTAEDQRRKLNEVLRLREGNLPVESDQKPIPSMLL